MRALIDLIDRYRPGFADAIEPAPSDLIEDFAELAGPLPGAYRRFLEVMGSGMDDFEPLGADFNIEDRLINYQIDSTLADTPYLLVAAGGPLDPGGSLYMKRDEPYGDDDCLLVVVPKEDAVANFDEQLPLHAGLEEFLYVQAYREIRLPLLRAGRELALDADPDVAKFKHTVLIAERLGFKRVPPCSRSVLLERGDAAMAIYRNPHMEAFSFQIAAEEPEELNRMTDIFIGEVPLQAIG